MNSNELELDLHLGPSDGGRYSLRPPTSFCQYAIQMKLALFFQPLIARMTRILDLLYSTLAIRCSIFYIRFPDNLIA